MGKKIVLVIENDEEIQYLIEQHLANTIKNIEIHKAFSGEEGVKKYMNLWNKGKKPDIVIMDLNLYGGENMDFLKKHMEGIGEMDGVKTAERILEIDKKAYIIGFTAYADLEWGEKLRKAGAKEIIGRYVGFGKFAKRIKEILE